MHEKRTVDEAYNWLLEHNSTEKVRIRLSALKGASELERARQLEANGSISVTEVSSDNAGPTAVIIKLSPQAIQRLEKP